MPNQKTLCKVNWLLESDTFGEGIKQLAEEIERQNMNIMWADKQVCRKSESYINLFPPNACVVFQGTINFANQIRREASWIPGAIKHKSNFLCNIYYPHFKEYLLAERFEFIRLGDVLKNKDRLFSIFGQESSLFIRPNSGDKPFTGQLIEYDRLSKDLYNLGPGDILDNELVIVSEPRNIAFEWRFFVADGQVITGSRYSPMKIRLNFKDVLDINALEFAQQAVDDARWSPDRIWAIDICLTESDNLYVIEINSFACSGHYASSPKILVEEASRIAIEEFNRAKVD